MCLIVYPHILCLDERENINVILLTNFSVYARFFSVLKNVITLNVFYNHIVLVVIVLLLTLMIYSFVIGGGFY